MFLSLNERPFSVLYMLYSQQELLLTGHLHKWVSPDKLRLPWYHNVHSCITFPVCAHVYMHNNFLSVIIAFIMTKCTMISLRHTCTYSVTQKHNVLPVQLQMRHINHTKRNWVTLMLVELLRKLQAMHHLQPEGVVRYGLKLKLKHITKTAHFIKCLVF